MELEKLKQLLGIPADDTAKDAALGFIIDDVAETITNYCNLPAVPKGLQQTAYRMAMDLYRGENVGDEAAAAGGVSSIKEGDITTSFRAAADGGFKESLLKNHTAQLNRYRKLAWP